MEEKEIREIIIAKALETPEGKAILIDSIGEAIKGAYNSRYISDPLTEESWLSIEKFLLKILADESTPEEVKQRIIKICQE